MISGRDGGKGSFETQFSFIGRVLLIHGSCRWLPLGLTRDVGLCVLSRRGTDEEAQVVYQQPDVGNAIFSDSYVNRAALLQAKGDRCRM